MKTAKQYKQEIDALTQALDVAEIERDQAQVAFRNMAICGSGFTAALDRATVAGDEYDRAVAKLAKARAAFTKYVEFLRNEQRFLNEGQ